MRNAFLASVVFVAAFGCAKHEDPHAGHHHDAASRDAQNGAPASAGLQKAPAEAGAPFTSSQLASTVLDPNRVADPIARDVYVKARDVADRLDRMYCYCHCSKQLGHKSLLTCFQDDHAVHCAICQREAVQAWLDMQNGLPVEASQRAADFAYNRGASPPVH